jgi:hypothetical protein
MLLGTFFFKNIKMVNEFSPNFNLKKKLILTCGKDFEGGKKIKKSQ